MSQNLPVFFYTTGHVLEVKGSNRSYKLTTAARSHANTYSLDLSYADAVANTGLWCHGGTTARVYTKPA